jgi:hypothetical protein
MISSLIRTLQAQSDIRPHEKVYINASTRQWSSDWLYGMFGDTMRFIRYSMAYSGYSRKDLREHIHQIMHQVQTVQVAIHDVLEPYYLSNLQRVELRSELERFVQSVKNLQTTYREDCDLTEFLNVILSQLQTFIAALLVRPATS